MNGRCDKCSVRVVDQKRWDGTIVRPDKTLLTFTLCRDHFGCYGEFVVRAA